MRMCSMSSNVLRKHCQIVCPVDRFHDVLPQSWRRRPLRRLERSTRAKERAEVDCPRISGHLSWRSTCASPLLEQLHRREAAAGRYIDDRVGRLLDAWQKLHEHRRIRRRAVRPWDRARADGGLRRPLLRGSDRLRRYVIRPERQSVRHRRRMNAAGNSAGDDDLVRFGRRQRRHFLGSSRAADSRLQMFRYALPRKRRLFFRRPICEFLLPTQNQDAPARSIDRDRAQGVVDRSSAGST